MKDEDWTDAIEQKRQQHSDDLYRTMSDESLNDMKKKVLEEYKRRQDIRYEELVQRQLEESKQLKEKSMYMDFSDAEEEK